MLDGKFIGKDKIPPEEIERMEEATKSREIESKACIFCGMHSNLQRSVNGKVVALCEQHFYSTNIGQVAQQIREKETVNG